MKNYVGISRDHSGSMRSIARAAARDYNSKVVSIREASQSNNLDTIVSVVECGYGHTDQVRRAVVNSSAMVLEQINEQKYQADGHGTPLWDSVGELIEMFESVPDYADKSVSFMVMAITDGEENASRKYSAQKIAAKIRELNNTDRWTFVFRVPRGYGRKIAALGISGGNIQEWDQTDRGVEIAAKRDAEAFTTYFSEKSRGITSTSKFYADLSNVSSADIAKVAEDISAKVLLWPVGTVDDQAEIRPFVEARLNGDPMLKGASFYQLTKTEPKVQDYKKIVIRDKKTNLIYGGDATRQMLGLPGYGDVRLAPKDLGDFDVFIQSTSVNRKVTKGSQVLYWKDCGTKFTEGPSAR
jgi:hypothetical protein